MNWNRDNMCYKALKIGAFPLQRGEETVDQGIAVTSFVPH